MPTMFQSDLDFAVFLNTRNPVQVVDERFVRTTATIADREYDNDTEHKRLLIRANRIITERKVAA